MKEDNQQNTESCRARDGMERVFGQLVILLFLMFVAVANADVGPRLTDEEFFTGLNLDAPGLTKLKTAVQNEDWQVAKEEFARYIRTRTKPEWFIDWRNCPKPKTPRPNTDDADKMLKNKFHLAGKWHDLGEKIDWGSTIRQAEGGFVILLWQKDLNCHEFFPTLYNAYRDTGEEKYAAKIIELMLDWITNCPVLVNKCGTYPFHYPWWQLGAAVRVNHGWLNAIYHTLNSKAMTDDALCIIFKSLVEHARYLDRCPSPSSNHLTSQSLAVFVVGTLLPEFTEAATWRQHAIKRLHKQLREEIYPDGLQFELALGYSNWVLSQFAKVLDLAKLNDHMSEIPEDFLNSLEKMYDYQTYAVMPDWIVPGFSDSPDCSPIDLLKKGRVFFPKRQDFIWAASKGQEGKMPEKESCAFSYSGHYVMRSGWDENARYLLFEAGPLARGYEDKLNFILHAYGSKLLLEAGTYRYDRSRWRYYVESTRGHNTIRVDREDQNKARLRGAYMPMPFRPLDNLWITEKDFDYVVGRYESGYGPNGAVRVTHKRAILFVKPDYWIVIDTLRPNSADNKLHEYESIFHLNAETAVKIPNTKAVVTENSNSANLVLLPTGIGDLSTEIVKGVEEEPIQGWVMGQPTTKRAVPTALFRWKAKGPSQLVTIVYPIPANGEMPIAGVKQLRVSPKTADAVAVQIEFTNGERHLLFYTDKPGKEYKYGSYETEMGLEFIKLDKGKKGIARFQQEMDKGYIKDEERIIAHLSGTYGWDDNHAVAGYRYGKNEQMMEKADFTTIVTDKGVKTTVDLGEGEIAVLEKLPLIILPADKPARLSMDYYNGEKAKFTLNNLWLDVNSKKSYYFMGEEAEIEIALNNYSSHLIKSSLSIETPVDWKIISSIDECAVPEGEVGIYKFKVKIPEREKAGKFKIKAAADNYSLKSTAYVNVCKPLKIDKGQFVFKLKHGASHISGKLPVTIMNQRLSESAGTVKLELGNGWEITPSEVKYKLPAEEEKTVNFTLRRNLDEPSDESGVRIIATSNGVLVTEKQALSPPPPICMVKSDFKPLIDGRLDEPGWGKTAKLAGFVNLRTGSLAGKQSTVYLSYDDKNLYIGAKFQDPDVENIKATVTKRGVGRPGHDDSIEVILDANLDYETGYELVMNSLDIWRTQTIIRKPGEIMMWGKWDEACQAKAFTGEDFWSVEIAVPFSSVADKAPEVGEIWGFGVSRRDYSQGDIEFSTWAYTSLKGLRRCAYLIFR